MKDLASACCLTAKNFKVLHQIVGNHRGPPMRSTQSEPPSKFATRPLLPSSSLTRDRDYESSIPSIAIKLGSFVQDPCGSASRAEQLFFKIRDFAKTRMERRRGSGQVADMRTHKAAYEAVCFYLIVTKEKLASKPQRSLNGNSEHAGDEERDLGVDDVLRACKQFTPDEFKQILRHTEKLLDEMKQLKKREQPAGVAPSRKPFGRDHPMSKASRKRPKGATNSMYEPVSEFSEAFLTDIEMAEEKQELVNEPYGFGPSNSSSYPESFLNWRRKVLAEAKELARDAIQSETGESGAEISDERAIAHAAEKVLSQVVFP